MINGSRIAEVKFESLYDKYYDSVFVLWLLPSQIHSSFIVSIIA